MEACSVCCDGRAQRCGRGRAVRRLCVGAGVAALARRHQRHEHRRPERVLERPLSRARQLARHTQQCQRRRHWVRWFRYMRCEYTESSVDHTLHSAGDSPPPLGVPSLRRCSPHTRHVQPSRCEPLAPPS